VRSLHLPFAVLLLAAGAVCGCATATPDVYGRTVTVVPTGFEAKKVKGELLAVDQSRLWLHTKEGVRDFDVAAVREVQVKRHDLGGGLARRIGLIGGLVSALALTASCASVEGNGGGGCAAIGAGIGGVWALTGVLSSMSLDKSSHARMSPDDLALRAYARFPAGRPKDAPPVALVKTPPPR
jgi:hypothetical protein